MPTELTNETKEEQPLTPMNYGETSYYSNNLGSTGYESAVEYANPLENTIRVVPGDDLQTAIDRLQETNGGRLFMRNGRYIIPASLTVHENVEIVGESITNTILDFTNLSGGSRAFDILGTESYSSDDDSSTISATNDSATVTSSGSSGHGAAIAAAVTPGEEILINWEQLYVVSEVTETAATTADITLTEVYNGRDLSGVDYSIGDFKDSVRLRNFSMDVPNGVSVMFFQNTKRLEVKDLEIIAVSNESITIQRSLKGIIQNIRSQEVGIDFSESGSFFVSNTEQLGDQLTMTTCRNFSLLNPTIRETAVSALSEAGSRNITINNYHCDNSLRGLSIAGENTHVAGGFITNCDRDGVLVGSQCEGCTINGLSSINNGTTGSYVGILISSGASSTIVTSCQLYGNSNGAISDSGTNTIDANNQKT